MSSSGPVFGVWKSAPGGCSRAPIDGLPPGKTVSVATFYWEDPAGHDIRLRDHHAETAPDVPQRVDVLRAADGYAVRMKTVKTDGWLIGEKDCTKLEVTTHEQSPAYKDGRPALAGHLALECRAKGSEISADLTFERCEY